jgi:undecaprenyl pyrophosphate phosphatase UppP
LSFVPKLRNCKDVHRHRKRAASEVFLFAIPPCNSRGSNYRCLLAQDLRGAEDIHFIGIESYAIDAAISAIVGYASIRILIGLVIKGKFYIFAFYCFAIGIATFFLL